MIAESSLDHHIESAGNCCLVRHAYSFTDGIMASFNDMGHLHLKWFPDDHPRLTAGARKRVKHDVGVEYASTGRVSLGMRACIAVRPHQAAARVAFLRRRLASNAVAASRRETWLWPCTCR